MCRWLVRQLMLPGIRAAKSDPKGREYLPAGAWADGVMERQVVAVGSCGSADRGAGNAWTSSCLADLQIAIGEGATAPAAHAVHSDADSVQLLWAAEELDLLRNPLPFL